MNNQTNQTNSTIINIDINNWIDTQIIDYQNFSTISNNIEFNTNTNWLSKLKYISKYIEKNELKSKKKKSKRFVIEI